MKYPIWLTLEYRKSYKKTLCYTKSITSEKDLIDFINRLFIDQSMIISFQVNGKVYSVEKLTNIFEKAQREATL